MTCSDAVGAARDGAVERPREAASLPVRSTAGERPPPPARRGAVAPCARTSHVCICKCNAAHAEHHTFEEPGRRPGLRSSSVCRPNPVQRRKVGPRPHERPRCAPVRLAGQLSAGGCLQAAATRPRHTCEGTLPGCTHPPHPPPAPPLSSPSRAGTQTRRRQPYRNEAADRTAATQLKRSSMRSMCWKSCMPGLWKPMLSCSARKHTSAPLHQGACSLTTGA